MRADGEREIPPIRHADHKEMTPSITTRIETRSSVEANCGTEQNGTGHKGGGGLRYQRTALPYQEDGAISQKLLDM